MKINKKNIIITGGTSGIGYEITKYLHPDNELIVISRNSNLLNTLSQEFKGIATYQADLSIIEDVETVANKIVKHYESIDILINNAAIQYTPTFLGDEFKYKNISHEITVNFTSICSLTYLLLPALLHQQKAVILNINSVVSLSSICIALSTDIGI